MPIFLIIIVLILALLSIPYILLFWWIKPVTALGIYGVICLGSILIIVLFVIIGLIQDYRSNR